MEILLGCVAVAITLAAPVIALISLVRSSSHQRRIERLEDELRSLRAAMTEPGRAREEGESISPEPVPQSPEEPAPVEEPPRPEEPPVEEPPVHEPPPMDPPHAPPSQPPPDLQEAAFTVAPPGRSESGPSIGTRIRTFDWESLVGVKLFSWIAGISLALAAVFFLKYSFDQGLLQPPVRMAIGLATGLGLLLACELRVAQRYRVTANAMDAAGIAILYATLFSSYAIWGLVPGAAAFLLMIAVTAIAVILSIRRDSVFIALLGLIGGFATPALLSSGEDHPITLFSYLLMLNAGLAWVAYRKRWPALAVLALAFTTVYQWGWVVEFLGSSNLPLAIAIFLAFPLLTVGAFLFGAREAGERSGLFGRSAAVASIVPVTFAVYMAAVPAYGQRHHLLFAFLLLVDGGLAAIAVSRRGPGALHAVGAISTVLVVMIWLGLSYSPAAWPSILGWGAALVVLYLMVPSLEKRLRKRSEGSATEWGIADRAVWAGPLLLAIFPVLAAIEPATASPWLLLGTLIVLVALAGFVAARTSSHGIHHLAALFALVALFVWSARYLDAGTLIPAVVLYVAFALLFVGVAAWSARDERSTAISPSFSLVGMFPLLFLLAGGAVAAISLQSLALLIGIILAGLYWQRSGSRSIVIVALLSWVVLQTWWSAVDLSNRLWPALGVVALLSLALLAGSVGTRRARSSPEAWFALAGHFFLLAVASRPDLTDPPWALLISLLVLTVALAVASRFLQPSVHLAGIIATQLVLLVWAGRLGEPWAVTCIVSTLGVAAFAVVWQSRGARSELDESRTLQLAALAGLFLAQMVTVAATRPDTPFVLILFAHAAIVLAALWTATRTGWLVAAVVATVPASIAIFSHAGDVSSIWLEEALLGVVLYGLFVGYPLVLGKRVGKAFEPYVAALIMSVSLFFFGRALMIGRGLEGVIGLLPLLQAGVLGILVYQLVTLEPRGERSLGRLALVAAAALAFVTVAVPLQFDHEWVTLAWALEGTALVWLYRRVPHRGLLWWSGVLLGVAFVRLTFNPAVFAYHPRSGTPILNWYLYGYSAAAAACFWAARLLPADSGKLGERLRAIWSSCGTILLFLLLNIEIADYYSTGRTITFDFSAGLAQDLTYTLGWALFAVGLLVVGLVTGHRAARVAAIGLLLASVLKGFLRDLMALGGLYRIASLAGLAIALAFVAILLQKFVLARRAGPVQTQEEPTPPLEPVT